MFNPEGRGIESINLLTANGQQLESLSERIIKNGGAVDILVHAFYTGPLIGRFPITPEYQQAVGGLIGQSFKQNHPLIVFESIVEDYPIPAGLLPEGRQGLLHFVPTLPAEPTPAIFGRPSLIYGLPFIETFCWGKLSQRFRQIGVKHINVGGRYMVLRPPADDTDEQILKKMKGWANRRQLAEELVDSELVPDCCPGAALYFLMGQGFDVSISSASSPTNRLESTDMSGLIKPSETLFF